MKDPMNDVFNRICSICVKYNIGITADGVDQSLPMSVEQPHIVIMQIRDANGEVIDLLKNDKNNIHDGFDKACVYALEKAEEYVKLNNL